MRRKINHMYVAAALTALSLGLGACSSGAGDKTDITRTAGQETGAQAGQQTGVQAVQETGVQAVQETGVQAGQETGVQTGQTQPVKAGPEHEADRDAVTGHEEATAETDGAPVLCLSLPEDESLYSHIVMDEEGDDVVRIRFYDAGTQSDAIAWASLKAEGGPSEYYVMDEENTRTQTAETDGGTQLEMTVRKTVENSDIHGIVVSWEHKGVFYELWEDDAREKEDAVKDTALAIAAQSIRVSETKTKDVQ